LKPALTGLWQDNADAWGLYHLLCGRTVRLAKLQGLVITKWTDGWAIERVQTLLGRLDLIGRVLEPDATPDE